MTILTKYNQAPINKVKIENREYKVIEVIILSENKYPNIFNQGVKEIWICEGKRGSLKQLFVK